MTDPLGPVVITGREIYDQLVRLGDAISALVTRMDRLADSHNAVTVEVKSDLTDHETRIRVLEKSRWPLPSLAVVLSLAGLILAFLKT